MSVGQVDQPQPESSGGDSQTQPNEPESRLTIIQAIQQVMAQSGHPMTIPQVYEAIVRNHLYQFKADDPAHIVRNEIRRHCIGLDFASASPRKVFKFTGDGRYSVLDSPVLDKGHGRARMPRTSRRTKDIDDFKQQYEQYIARFKSRVLDEIRNVGPRQFEHFCRNLLSAYGFLQVKVTRFTKDGGIDGHGRLKVGFDYFNVAFQCKRRTRGNVGRPEISQFRGDIQGQYALGYFFTTASFTPEAKDYSVRRGAVPITLINGPTIVEIMLEKGFGVDKEDLPIYSLALDLIFSD
jgi:restriction system protein